ncbi:MAG: VCBS repeat-containing protein, partial [Planctomycetota bacterium]|nr:VCBS repeat-containing protein [Planctomycetota bacterium]
MPKLILLMTCSLSLWADLEDKPSSVLEGISSPYQLELADFSNDGKTDLAVSSWARLPVKGEQYDFDKHRVLLFFQKEGRFSLPADRQVKMRQPWGMRAGDFDEDGKTD